MIDHAGIDLNNHQGDIRLLVRSIPVDGCSEEVERVVQLSAGHP